MNIITQAKRIHQAAKEYYNSDTNTSTKPCIEHISKVRICSFNTNQLKTVTLSWI